MLPSNLTDCSTLLLACVNSSTLLAIGRRFSTHTSTNRIPHQCSPATAAGLSRCSIMATPQAPTTGAVSSEPTERRCEARAVGYRSPWTTIRSPWQANITRRARDSRVCGLALAAEMGPPAQGDADQMRPYVPALQQNRTAARARDGKRLVCPCSCCDATVACARSLLGTRGDANGRDMESPPPRVEAVL